MLPSVVVDPNPRLTFELHLKRTTVRFEKTDEPQKYQLNASFDTLVRTKLYVWLYAAEILNPSYQLVKFQSLNATPPLEFQFEKGLGLKIPERAVIVDITQYNEYKATLKNKHNFFIVLHLIAITDLGLEGASTSLCIKRDRPKDNEEFGWRVAAHRYHMSGLCWNLYEIFGLPKNDAAEEENSCVVCMSEPKSSAVIPCGHVCLCQRCGETLQKQPQAKCPICRTGVQFLVRKQTIAIA